MPKKISIDEVIARRKDLGTDAAPIVKAAKAPASWNKANRSARFTMNAEAPDRYGDVVVTAGIQTDEFQQNPVALLFHASRSWPIGRWGNLEKILKGRPPRLDGDLELLPAGGPVKEIDEAAWMIENGGIRACSIGFVPDWDEAEMILDDEGKWMGGIKWNRSTLVEASLVPVPASPQSLIKSADGNMRLARELIEDILDNWAKSPEGLLLPRAEFEQAYRATVERIASETPVAANIAPTECEPATPEITDEAVAAFVALSADGDTVSLDVGTEPQLSLVRAGEPIERLVLPLTMNFADASALHKKVGEAIQAKSAPLEPGAETTAPGNVSLSIEIDTTEATEKLTAFERLLDGIVGKLGPILGRSQPKERIEPTIEPVDEIAAPPSAEAVKAAETHASEVLQRLAKKGLIAA